jgi:N-methylhydantoinase A
MGLLAAPTSAEAVRTSMRDLSSVSAEDLRRAWRGLEAEARAALAAQRVDPAHVRWSADCRYRGQGYELDVDAPGDADPRALGELFHERHHERYGFHHPGGAVEV